VLVLSQGPEHNHIVYLNYTGHDCLHAYLLLTTQWLSPVVPPVWLQIRPQDKPGLKIACGSISLHTEAEHYWVITVPGQDCHCQRPSRRAWSWQKKPWLGRRHLEKVHCPSVEADELEAELWITYLETTSLHCWSNCRGHLLEATTSRDSVNDGVKIIHVATSIIRNVAI